MQEEEITPPRTSCVGGAREEVGVLRDPPTRIPSSSGHSPDDEVRKGDEGKGREGALN